METGHYMIMITVSTCMREAMIFLPNALSEIIWLWQRVVLKRSEVLFSSGWLQPLQTFLHSKVNANYIPRTLRCMQHTPHQRSPTESDKLFTWYPWLGSSQFWLLPNQLASFKMYLFFALIWRSGPMKGKHGMSQTNIFISSVFISAGRRGFKRVWWRSRPQFASGMVENARGY